MSKQTYDPHAGIAGNRGIWDTRADRDQLHFSDRTSSSIDDAIDSKRKKRNKTFSETKWYGGVTGKSPP